MDLYDAVENNPKVLEEELSKYLPQNRLSAVMRANASGKSAFWHAIRYPESLRIILKLLPETDRLAAVMMKNAAGQTAFELAIQEQRESLPIILESLPEPDRLKTLIEYSYLCTVTTNNTESFKILLDYLGGQAYLDALKSCECDYVLDEIVTNHKLFSILSEHLSDSEFINFLNFKIPLEPKPYLYLIIDLIDSNETVFEKAVKYPISLELILNRLKGEAYHQFVMVHTEALLYLAIKNEEYLEIVSKIFPPERRSEFVINKRHFLLQEAFEGELSLDIILKILPEDMHFSSVVDSCKSGPTPLHRVHNNTKNLRTILSIYPASERIKALMARNQFGIMPFLSFINEDGLDVIFKLIPVEDQKALFTHKKQPIYSYNERHKRARTSPEVLPALICDYINDDTLKKFPSLNTYLIIDKHLAININDDNTGYFFNFPIIERASRKLWRDIDKAQNLQGIKDALIDFISEDATHAKLPEVASLILDLEKDANNTVSQELLSTIRDTVTKYQKQPDYCDPAEYRLC